MKIILASSSSGSRGGGELYLLYLGRALAQRGHEVTLWASSHPRMDELANSFSAFGSVQRAPYQNTYDQRGRSIASQLNLWSSARAALEWRRSGADFLHLNKQNLEDGLDLLRAARFSGIPNLCTIHLTQSASYLRAKLAGIRDWVSRRALWAYPGLLVAVLESRRRDLLDFLGPTPRIRMIPNGVPLYDLKQKDAVRAAKRDELGFSEKNLVFLDVGRMVAQKRPLLFLESAARIHKILPEARFLWVGDGTIAPEWDRWVAEHQLENVIRRYPWQPDVQPFLLSADVFFHVAEFEGLPLALLEALSASLPVMLTPNLLREMPFLNKDNAIPFTGTDEDILALRDRNRLLEIGFAGRHLVEAEFSFAKMAENYEMLYDFTRRRQS
ncbi:glycosyltransferase family 4 protein [Verrucomicrobiota bacterium sgz303538]